MPDWEKLSEEIAGTDAVKTPETQGRDQKPGVTISITPRTLRLLGLVAALGATAFFAVPFLVEHVPLPMLHCERLDRRCQRAMQSGSNLSGAMVCGMTGFLTLGGRTQEQCKKANEVLDRVTGGGEGTSGSPPSNEAGSSEQARLQMEELTSALELFKLEHGRYPTSADGLDALTRPVRGKKPILNEVALDPWGNELLYFGPNNRRERYMLVSTGPDGKRGGGDDVVVGDR